MSNIKAYQSETVSLSSPSQISSSCCTRDVCLQKDHFRFWPETCYLFTFTQHALAALLTGWFRGPSNPTKWIKKKSDSWFWWILSARWGLKRNCSLSNSLGTDPPSSKPQPAIFSVPPGTEDLTKSPETDKSLDNSDTFDMFNNNTYTNFKTAYTHVNSVMVSCSRIIWITNSSNHRRVWTVDLLHTEKLPNPQGHKV